MIIDGKKIAKVIQDNLANRVDEVDDAISLHIFVVGENSVIESFVKYKKHFADNIGVEFVEYRLSNSISEVELIENIRASVDEADGIVVQLPLPRKMNTQRVLDAVPKELDIDGLATGSDYLAPVAGAIREILEYQNIDIKGRDTLVIGRGKLVGEPVARLLDSLGARVTIVDRETGEDKLRELCKQSYMIVSGAGVPNLITADMVSEGCVLIDAGTSTSGGSVVGDIALDCESVALHFARTPGGVGPMTIAVLFKNLVGGRLVTK